MAISLDPARQYVLSTDFLTIAFDDIDTSGVAEAAFELPPNAVVVGGEVVVDTAWDSATTDTLDLGDDADDDRYLSAVDLQSTGRTALTITNFLVTEADTLDVLITNTGGSLTAGSLRLRVEYVVQDRSNENEGTGSEFGGSGN